MEKGVSKLPLPCMKDKDLEEFLSNFTPVYLRTVYLFWVKEDNSIISYFEVAQKNNNPKKRKPIPHTLLFYFFSDRILDCTDVDQRDEKGYPYVDPRFFLPYEKDNTKKLVDVLKEKLESDRLASQTKKVSKRSEKCNGADHVTMLEKKFYYSSNKLEEHVRAKFSDLPSPDLPESGNNNRNRLQTLIHYTSEDFIVERDDLLKILQWAQNDYNGL
jgi:hypothetical protein